MAAVPKLQKGGTETLLVTSVGNKLIDAVNSVAGMQVQPSSMGSFKFAPGQSVLDLTEMVQQITNLSTVQYTDIGGNVVNNNITTAINNLNYSMRNPSISALCNPDGTITITLTFPTP